VRLVRALRVLTQIKGRITRQSSASPSSRWLAKACPSGVLLWLGVQDQTSNAAAEVACAKLISARRGQLELDELLTALQ
jgi:hypothetical protein